MDVPQQRDRVDCESPKGAGDRNRRRARACSLFATLFALIALASPIAASAGDHRSGGSRPSAAWAD
jgi:hypothetical protein